MTAEMKKNVVCPPLISNFTPQIHNVLLDGLSELPLARVHMCHRLRPYLGVGQRQIDYVALEDMVRVEHPSQDGQKCSCIDFVWEGC